VEKNATNKMPLIIYPRKTATFIRFRINKAYKIQIQYRFKSIFVYFIDIGVRT